MSFKPSKECIILAQSNCSSQLNNSNSKQQYSFAHNSRFDKDEQKLSQNKKKLFISRSQVILGQPSIDTQKGPIIGSSNRFDFTNNIEQQLNPAPNQYIIEGEFDKIKKKASKGYSLALGREKILACNYESKGPGPCSYKNEKILKNSPKYSMAQKFYPKGKSIIYKEESPAPDNYSLPNTIDSIGKYQLSNYQGSKAPLISSPIEKKIKYQKVCPPGPGSYEQIDMKREKGVLQYYEAKFKSYQGQSFASGRKTRSLPKIIKSPGPGQYQMPSEFGVPLQNFPKYKNSRKSSIQSNLYSLTQKKVQERRSKPVEKQQKRLDSLILGKYLPPIIKDVST